MLRLRLTSGLTSVAAAATASYFYNSKLANSQAKEKNTAFVFIKVSCQKLMIISIDISNLLYQPHANTTATQNLVQSQLKSNGLTITQQGELTAEQIDKGMLIDQHYYAIASKATLLKPKDLPVPANKFEEFFGISWKKALDDGLVYNALDACKYLEVDATGLDKLWAKAKKVKFGGGFYCGLVEKPGKKSIYVF